MCAAPVDTQPPARINEPRRCRETALKMFYVDHGMENGSAAAGAEPPASVCGANVPNEEEGVKMAS